MNLYTLTFDSGITFGHAINVAITGFVVVLIVLALLAVLVKLLSIGVTAVVKKTEKKDSSSSEAENNNVKAEIMTSNLPSVSALPDNQSAGSLDLYKTDEKTAAVIMAIVSKDSGVPLNRLRFNSIKLIEENN